ncbi:apolipoprotein C-IV [Onychostoma macrolepis]|uniref:apolipoprotein C-IV n=1 Tax=Onychostoma macrolepis TaxID=369639 RepID=UPI00272CF71A|nr:apolipoprotein C-IV [Onychostoma macrolepis]
MLKMSRLIFFVLVVTLQVCLASSNPLPTPAPDNAGLIERAKQAYRDTKTKVLNVGNTVAGFAGMYYEEHLKPVTDPYMEWAKDRASSVWERVKSRVPSFRSTQDQ